MDSKDYLNSSDRTLNKFYRSTDLSNVDTHDEYLSFNHKCGYILFKMHSGLHFISGMGYLFFIGEAFYRQGIMGHHLWADVLFSNTALYIMITTAAVIAVLEMVYYTFSYPSLQAQRSFDEDHSKVLETFKRYTHIIRAGLTIILTVTYIGLMTWASLNVVNALDTILPIAMGVLLFLLIISVIVDPCMKSVKHWTQSFFSLKPGQIVSPNQSFKLVRNPLDESQISFFLGENRSSSSSSSSSGQVFESVKNIINSHEKRLDRS
jgi:hypothetical protein